MSELVVRRLLVDLRTPPARHWNGGDAFRTALFNALSLSFPAGEQFFIDSVRRGLDRLPEAERVRFADEVKGFIGQEATHRRVHELFNAHLEQRGIVNHWQVRIARRLKRLEGVDARGWLGVTAATEHFTALLADYLLTHDAPLAGAEPRLRDLWLWHASEESEHRCTAFDLYRAAGGREKWRRRLFWVVSFHFATDLARQTVHNLHRDGTLWRWSTWASAARVVLGREGLVRTLFAPWKRYLASDFHPSEGNVEVGLRWLAEHPEVARPLTAPAGG